MTTPESPDRTVHVKEPVEDGETEVDGTLVEGTLVDRKGPAQADAEDPSMGGSSDGDTGA